MEQQILKYRIERELGQGGMSRVYLGVDPVTGQRVANVSCCLSKLKYECRVMVR